MKKPFILLFLTLVVSINLALPKDLLGSKLDEFEADATRERPADNSEGRTEESGTDKGPGIFDSILGAFLDPIFEGLLEALHEGGTLSYDRVSDIPGTYGFSRIEMRDVGEPVIPYFRLDFNYQDVQSDVIGLDGRVEIGYGPFGLQFRRTHYEEVEPNDELDLIQINGLYRMSFSKSFELDLGLGSLILNGNRHSTGLSFTIPVQYHPSRFVGIQFRPNLSSIKGNLITDLDLGFLFSKGIFSIQAGYRWLYSPDKDLNGPYIGTSFHF